MNYLNDKEIFKLCDEQASLFSKSINYDFSSENFYLFYLKNPETRIMDNGEYIDLFHLFKSVKNVKKKCIKYSEKVMRWIGYITRFMALTTDLSSNDIANIISCAEFNELYYVLHTQDVAKATNEIMRIKKDKIIDKNVQLKRLLTEKEAKEIVTH